MRSCARPVTRRRGTAAILVLVEAIGNIIEQVDKLYTAAKGVSASAENSSCMIMTPCMRIYDEESSLHIFSPSIDLCLFTSSSSASLHGPPGGRARSAREARCGRQPERGWHGRLLRQRLRSGKSMLPRELACLPAPVARPRTAMNALLLHRLHPCSLREP